MDNRGKSERRAWLRTRPGREAQSSAVLSEVFARLKRDPKNRSSRGDEALSLFESTGSFSVLSIRRDDSGSGAFKPARHSSGAKGCRYVARGSDGGEGAGCYPRARHWGGDRLFLYRR